MKDLHPSVIQRYRDETFRIFGVLEKRLAEQGEWLALKRFTLAGEWIQAYHTPFVDAIE